MSSDERARREARNQALFRDVNERIEQVYEGFGTNGGWEFLCECGRTDCEARIVVPPANYEAVRAHPRRFLVAAGHEAPATERVIEYLDGVVVVEALGVAGEVAEETAARRD